MNLKKQFLFFFAALHLACAAAPPPIELQAGNLRTILRQADDAYYNHHESLMGDAAYDALRAQYDRLVAQYPELADLPNVGAPVAHSSSRIEHNAPVLSLQKAYSDEAVETFIQTCGTNLLYCIEPKIDGLTVVLRYQNGLLTQAITRGDGKTGIDVTAALLASGATPLTLTNAPAKLNVRAEVHLPLPAFNALNQRRKTAGQPPLKSPRNTAAGTLRLHDYAEIANRALAIRVFELLATDPMPATHTQALALLKSVGLPTIESRTVDPAEVLLAVAELNRRRVTLPFSTDGIVIKVDDQKAFARLGKTAHHPRGALARKYKETPIETRLLQVDWSRGSTGKVTPIARFEPIEIQGATVRSASLYNLDHIRAMDLRIGDWIQVIRAGGTVPEIIGICPNRRIGTETPILAPTETSLD